MPYSYSQSVKIKTIILEGLAWLVLWPFQRRERPERLDRPGCRILLVEPFQMGDILSLTPLIDPLQERFPGCQLFFLTKPSSAAVLRLDKRIAGVLEFDFIWSDYGHKRKISLQYLWQLGRYLWELRKSEFDLGIDTRGDVRSQILLSLSGCRARIGYRRYLASNVQVSGRLLTRSLPGDVPMHRYDWNLNLLALLGVSSGFSARFPSFKPTLREEAVPAGSYILVHVGGGWEFKRWSETKWAELIDRLVATGRKTIVIGAGPEGEILTRVGRLLKTPNDKAQFRTTTLNELIALVAACKLFVGLDSGPMNLAVCLGKPVVALFGPGDSAMWYPYAAPGNLIHHVEKYPCNPCSQSVCQFAAHNCMSEIRVDEVAELVDRELQ